MSGIFIENRHLMPSMVGVHIFIPSTTEEEEGGSLSLRAA